MRKIALEKVLEEIRFGVAGDDTLLTDIWIKGGGDWLSFVANEIENINEGMEYTLIAKAFGESDGSVTEGTEVYMASTPLLSGNLLIEIKIPDPYIDSQGWAVKDEEVVYFLC